MRAFVFFCKDRSGNITIMFAMMLTVILLFTGGAVDFTRRNAVRADLIESLDAAGLAIAQLDESGNAEMATLTAAQKEAYLKDYGAKFFHENFSHENEIQNFSLDFVMTEQTIKPVATGEIKTLFLGVAEDLMNLGANSQFDTLSMAASTEITRRGSGPIELALVLDVTGSMSSSINGTPKIDSLKTAVDALLDTLYGDDDNATSEYVTTSVVPFAAYVNSGAAENDDGASAWNSAWNDTTASAYYHGAHFLHVNSSSVIDLNTKVNHFNLFNSISGETSDGCNEERPYPLDEIDVESGTAASNATITSYNVLPGAGSTNTVVLNAFSGAPSLKLSVAELSTIANSKFVPLFQADDPDCSNSACEWGSTLKTLNGISYRGNWFHNPSTDGYDGYGNSYIKDRYYTTTSYSANLGKYLPVVNYAEKVLRTHNGESSSTECATGSQTDSALNTWFAARGATECRDDEYVLRQAYVGLFDATTSTYLGKLDQPNSIGSSSGPNDNCPSAAIFYGTDSKAAVHDFVQSLSPGGNTNSAEGMMWGWRVVSPEAPFESPNPYDDDKWQKAVVLMTDGFNTVSSADTPWSSEMTPYGYAREERMGVGVNSASEMRDEIDNKLVRICTRMKADGILVYAITFGLDDSDPDELATKKVFQACATKDEAPYYFDAPAGEDLEDAFADIASDLVQLHVSK
jgi:Flp pilus assembly protein TadG